MSETKTASNGAMQKTGNTQIAKHEPTNSERFTEKVMNEFKGSAGDTMLSQSQKRLIQNYFMSIDQILKTSEDKRLSKSEEYRDNLAFEWKNVNLQILALRVVAWAKVGLDPMQPNHLNPIPYKNKRTNQYDITFIPGYRGLELKSSKYGLDIPSNVTVELVYQNDDFRPIKKDRNNKVEGYDFEVPKPFDRGEVVGGFYYKEFFNAPEKNKLVFYTVAEIEKRKPAYASAEFWGGEKDVWKKVDGKNKVVGTEKVEGWRTEMLWKTISRAAWNSITIDPQKIDDEFMTLLEAEREASVSLNDSEIDRNANRNSLSFDDAEVIEEIKPTQLASPAPMETVSETPVADTRKPSQYTEDELLNSGNKLF